MSDSTPPNPPQGETGKLLNCCGSHYNGRVVAAIGNCRTCMRPLCKYHFAHHSCSLAPSAAPASSALSASPEHSCDDMYSKCDTCLKRGLQNLYESVQAAAPTKPDRTELREEMQRILDLCDVRGEPETSPYVDEILSLISRCEEEARRSEREKWEGAVRAAEEMVEMAQSRFEILMKGAEAYHDGAAQDLSRLSKLLEDPEALPPQER